MSGESKTTISSKNVTVNYGRITALHDFSVDVPSGIVGLLGPNGAGKSTFIKAIVGLLEPASGRITIAGKDSRTEGDIIRDMIGYMPENDCLIDTFTAVELVSYMGQISGMRRMDAMPRSHEMLDFVGIGEERYRPISSYSTGMKQRVKLAQAIVHDPKILFLDEPTNGMDPQGREEMLNLVKKIRASDKSILVSTHILDDLEKISDHAIIINDGRLVTQGNLDTLLEGSESLRVVKVRGQSESMENFVRTLGTAFEVRDVTRESGQISAVILNSDDGNPIFKLSRECNVQLRAYYPHRATLEDVFVSAVEGKKQKGAV
ncbi:MAG: ABC transporter ATP-binding protein [Candidatus Thermoplasmatota archaeon]|nr:ABC transporter ATP-binding protein [Euryarchaeota archaeon]MBU4031391.1 ABC transporter ATP-binding protein [Candidatus Thermoplasmatota archaeon]MBU4072227.1 ABC transporter ATP-binding protein [Candidatus Thermoplasmatota archaeon]MBU4145282.1 ABC transporter ATP-binding protein [Candidatus Thermoplasmatota archaeon]MBU4591236.1 ABC transporter ATP-binding protein [Candidatus Thermoplasmatota archaeon]